MGVIVILFEKIKKVMFRVVILLTWEVEGYGTSTRSSGQAAPMPVSEGTGVIPCAGRDHSCMNSRDQFCT